MKSLQQEVDGLIRSVTSAYEEDHRPTISVVLAGAGALDFDICGKVAHLPASTMKLPLMVELFRQVDAGQLSLEDFMPVENRFASVHPPAGPFSVDPVEDSDFQLYRYIGKRVAIRFLLERMITVSSNMATNLLFSHVEVAKLNATLDRLGAADVRVGRGIEDMAALEHGVRSQVTAQGLTAILQAIGSEVAAKPASCREMLAILSRQQWNDEIPAGLPPEAVVAHKTGWLERVQHDTALIYPPTRPPYALTILTSGVADAHVARRLIQQISRTVYKRVTATWPPLSGGAGGG